MKSKYSSPNGRFLKLVISFYTPSQKQITDRDASPCLNNSSKHSLNSKMKTWKLLGVMYSKQLNMPDTIFGKYLLEDEYIFGLAQVLIIIIKRELMTYSTPQPATRGWSTGFKSFLRSSHQLISSVQPLKYPTYQSGIKQVENSAN